MKSLLMGAIALFTLMTIGCSKTEMQNAQHNNKSIGVLTTPPVSTICPWGDDEDPQPMLYGRVKDEATLVDLTGVCVNLETSSQEFIAVIGTDSLGHYYFNEVDSGSYNLIFSKVGYAAQTIPVTVVATPQEVNTQLTVIP